MKTAYGSGAIAVDLGSQDGATDPPVRTSGVVRISLTPEPSPALDGATALSLRAHDLLGRLCPNGRGNRGSWSTSPQRRPSIFIPSTFEAFPEFVVGQISGLMISRIARVTGGNPFGNRLILITFCPRGLSA